MLNEFISWYGERLGELVPALGRGPADDGPPDALIVDMRAASLEAVATLSLSERSRRRDRPLGEFLLDQLGMVRARAAISERSWPDVLVILPRGTLLERVVTLPQAAETGLASVLGYEMDRYTPFAADEVHWSATIISRDAERIAVRIVLAPRARLAPIVEMMERLGAEPTMIESAAADGVARWLPLHAPDPAAGRAARRALIAASICCVLLAGALAGLPFLRQYRAADRIEARIAALQPDVSQADALRQRLIAQTAGSDAIANERLRLGEPLEALAALTQLMPDDTFLTVLTLHQRQLAIDGQSASAARLIGLLSTDPVIRDAAFSAPVTRTEDGADMFSLKAEVRS